MTSKLIAGFPQFPIAPSTGKVSYLCRMQRLWEKMADNSVCVLVSNPEALRSNDTHNPYRQSSEIVYLNGFPEAESALILSKLNGEQNLIMLVQPKDIERETWDGIRFGTEGARKHFFANEAYPLSDFAKVLGKLLRRADAVYYRYGQNPDFDEKFRKVWQKKQPTLLNHEEIIDELRLLKSDEELKIIRHACKIAA
ncbi:MAG: aminopeptidase P N-terminal domain-containing protein [Candidatus Obscuribacterales bacterium]|nr:aminopeptidase P N-terminal domain-containing protein [Candidatus Obscuribacterales bacterium]